MKAGIRYIAIASGPIKERKRSLLVGVIFRDNYIEGLLSSSIQADGTDSTRQIVSMIAKSRFRDQVKLLLSNGIALAGLNVIDPFAIRKQLGIETLLVNRRRQNAVELLKALNEFSRITGKPVLERKRIVKEYSLVKPIKANGFYLQSGLEGTYVRRMAANSIEALRVAHIIARGIASGESKGRL